MVRTADNRRYLQVMGIDVWLPRAAAIDAAVNSEPAADVPDGKIYPPEINPAVTDSIENIGWDGLAARVADCALCGLQQSRTQTVFGMGNRNADWMIIGEAPGAEEDRQGEPFVGRGGQLLDNILRAVGLNRGTVFIANILKCRPPGNRDPKPEETAHCSGYLQRQIALVQPKLIVAVGRIAAQYLLNTETPIGRLRGRVHEYQGIPLIVTYHPAYLLRSPQEKRKVWQDLQLARKIRGEA